VTVRGVRSIIAVIIVVVLYVTGAKIVQIERNTKGKLVFLWYFRDAAYLRAELKDTTNPGKFQTFSQINIRCGVSVSQRTIENHGDGSPDHLSTCVTLSNAARPLFIGVVSACQPYFQNS
jgi:hypothetical protein